MSASPDLGLNTCRQRASFSSAFSLELPSEGSPCLLIRAGSAPPQGGLVTLAAGSKLPATAKGPSVAPPWFPPVLPAWSTESKGGGGLADPPQKGPLIRMVAQVKRRHQFVFVARCPVGSHLSSPTCHEAGGFGPHNTTRMPRRAMGLRSGPGYLGLGRSSRLKTQCPFVTRYLKKAGGKAHSSFSCAH